MSLLYALDRTNSINKSQCRQEMLARTHQDIVKSLTDLENIKKYKGIVIFVKAGTKSTLKSKTGRKQDYTGLN